MSARGNMVLKDRTTPTPADHTFSPDGDDANGVHVWSEKVGVAAGNPRFTATMRKAKDKYRHTIRLAVPVVATQTINGVSSPVVLRTGYLALSVVFSELSTAQERADAVGLFYNSLAASNTQVNDMLVNLNDVW